MASKETKKEKGRHGLASSTSSSSPASSSSKKSDNEKTKKTVSFTLTPTINGDKHTNLPSLPSRFAQLINNPLYADVEFLVGGKKLSGHSCIINARCPGLLNPLDEKGQPHQLKKKKNMIEVEVSTSISTFFEILRFVYTGQVDLSSMKDQDIILLDAATTHFEGLSLLQWLCETTIKKNISERNIHEILKEAERFQLKDLKEFCLHFAVDHFPDFVRNKEASKNLGIDLFQEVAELYFVNQAGELKPLADAAPPSDTYMDDFKMLHDNSKGSDIDFQLLDRNVLGISGSHFKAHRVIVANTSPPLAELCAQAQTSKNSNSVNVKGISTDGFSALMKWIYYGDTDISTIAACELIPFCKEYKIPELQSICVAVIRNSVDIDSVLSILDLSYLEDMPNFFNDAMQEVKPKCIEFILDRFMQVDLKQIRTRKLKPSISVDILMALQKRSINTSDTNVGPSSMKDGCNDISEKSQSDDGVNKNSSSPPTSPSSNTKKEKKEKKKKTEKPEESNSTTKTTSADEEDTNSVSSVKDKEPGTEGKLETDESSAS